MKAMHDSLKKTLDIGNKRKVNAYIVVSNGGPHESELRD